MADQEFSVLVRRTLEKYITVEAADEDKALEKAELLEDLADRFDAVDIEIDEFEVLEATAVED